jgi:hypothetical protein
MDLLWLVVPSDVGFAGQRTLLSASEGPYGVCVDLSSQNVRMLFDFANPTSSKAL